MTMNASSDAAGRDSKGRRSIIDAESRFVGTYTTTNELQIEGQYEGTINCTGLVTVAESAEVDAQVTAGAVAVEGRLRGDVGCRGRFEIFPSGQVEAKVEAASIVVHDGARFDGEMRMRAADENKATEGSATSVEPRPGRRTSHAETAGLPRLHAESPPANGRSSSGATDAQPDSELTSSSGQPTDPAAGA
jgi:cytoskeletal protein CcmA (bactofilin family)